MVSHSATGLTATSTGGSERQAALLARGLAARGHDVAFVVTGFDGEEGVVDGVRLRAGWKLRRGVRYVRAVTYRYPELVRVLRDERADVYYSRGAGYHTPFVVATARALGAISVLGLASDRDLYASSGKVLFGVPDRRVSALIGPLAHAVYRKWGLRAADWVAVQNDDQAAACCKLGLRQAIIPNIVELPAAGLATTSPERDVVW